MVLAAGRGERMRPLSARCAKPALPVLGVPLVGRIVRHLAAAGVERFSVNAHHLPATIEAAIRENLAPDQEVQLFVEPQLMGTGGALLAPRARLAASSHFVIHNGDTLTMAPLAALWDAAQQPSCLGVLLVRPGRTSGYGAIAVANGRFVALLRGEAPSPPGTAAATYLGVGVLRREVLETVPADRPTDLFSDLLLPQLDATRFLAVVPHNGSWLEFTSPRSYLHNTLRLVNSGRAATRLALAGGEVTIHPHPNGALYVGPDAVVASSVQWQGSAVLEAGARLEAGSFVRRALVMRGAIVGAGCYLDDVVVDAGVVVPPSTVARSGTLSSAAGQLEFHPFGEL